MTFVQYFLLFAFLCSANAVRYVVPSPEVQKKLDSVRNAFDNRLLEAADVTRHAASNSINSFLPDVRPQPLNKDGFITCPPGYTGPTCEILYCVTQGQVENVDGTQGYGAIVETASVTNCDGNFTFPADIYLGTVYLFVTASPNANPSAILSDRNGIIYRPNEVIEQTDSAVVYQFNSLPASTYSALLHSDTARNCIAIARGTTPVTVSGGFVSNLTSDFPVGHMVEYELNWFVCHVIYETSPAHPTALLIFENNELIASFPNLNDADHTRYHCAYEYYAGTMTCTSVNVYIYKIQGVDSNGNVWQRVDTFPCFPPALTTGPPVTGSTTSPPPVTSCENGGQLMNTTTEMVCYCTQYYTGRRCEITLCFNGGTFIPADGSCSCQGGFGGDHCQHVQCSRPSGYNFDTSKRALVFIVRNSNSMQNSLKQIYSAAVDLTAFYSAFHPDYITEFVLTTFANGTLSTTVYRNPGTFADAIRDLSTVPGGCDDSVLTAIESTFTSGSFARAPVFIFTDAVANDYRQRFAVMNQLSFWRGELYFVVIDPMQGCSIDTVQPGYRVFGELARFSHGLLSYFQQGTLGTMVYRIGTYLYKTDTILIDDLINCQNQLYFQPFFVDSQTSDLIILATGTSLSLMLTLPNGTVINPSPNFYENNTYAWTFGASNKLTLESGAYFLSLNSSVAPCSYRVKARTDLQFFFAVSNNINNDASMPQPVWKSEAHIVAHLNTLSVTHPLSLYAQGVVTTNFQDTRTVLYASNGLYRDRCDFSLYFGPWTCLMPEQTFYITVFGNDNNGRTFQRSLTGFCSAGAIPSVPPDGCANGGVIQNGICYCPPLWQGTQCTQIQCLNGGSSLGSACQCPPGFTSTHCEQVTCYQTNLNPNFRVNGRSLTFVLQNSLSMKYAIQQISDEAVTLVNDIQSQHPNWISQYQIVLFDDTSVQVQNSTTPQGFIDGLHSVFANIPSDFPPCGPQQTIPALIAALQNAKANGLVFVFTDKPAMLNDSVQLVLGLVEQLNAQIFFAITNPRPCGDPFLTQETQIFGNIAEASSGTAFVVASYLVKNWLQYIPTIYSSGLVYEDYAIDCTTQNQTFYFPVDSHAQSITVAAFGFGNTIQLIPPGSTAPHVAIYDIYDDNNLHIVSAVQACEFGWNWDGETHCFLFGILPLNWTDARDSCHSSNSALATVFDYKISQFLNQQGGGIDFWIGLNDIDQLGVFVWDSIDANNSQSLNTTQYQEWGPHQPSNDPLLRCVVEQHASNEQEGWTTISCSVSHAYVCMKHAFNAGFEPEDPNENSVKPGIWQMTVSTTALSGKPQPCAVQVRSQSSIQMYSGFVTGVHSDMAVAEPVIGSRSNMMVAHVSHLVETELQMSGSLQYMHMYRENLTIEQVQTFASRGHCAFEFVSTPFRCPDNQFQVLATGIDQYGYLFQRIQSAICLGGAVGACGNGGQLSDGICYCTPLWTGMNCETAICVNGGTLMPGGLHCQCPNGYNGYHCEYDVCLPQVPVNFYEGDVSLVLVIDGTNSNADTVAQLKVFMSQWLNALSTFQSGWFLNYILVVFRDHSTVPIIEPPYVTNNIQMLVSFFENATTTLPDDGDCPKNVLGGLLLALQSPKLLPNSVVLVFTGSVPFDPYLEKQVIDQVALTHATVHFIITDATGLGPCGSFEGSQAQPYFDIAQVSGGNVYHINPSNLTSFLSTFTPTLYSSANLVQMSSTDCSSMTHYIQVDYHTRELTIDIFAMNGSAMAFQSVNVTNPNGTLVSAQRVITGTTSRTFLEIFTISQSPGIWTLTLSTQGPCNVQVRGQSPMEAFVAYTQDSVVAHSDVGGITPSQGSYTNAVLAHATDNGLLNYVEFLDPVSGKLLWASTLKPRVGCSYEFYSNRFTCPITNFLVALYGSDYLGHPVRRLNQAHCVGPEPTPPPTTTASTLAQSTSSTTSGPSTSSTTGTSTSGSPTVTVPCNLTNVIMDVVFVFDTSSTAGQATFENEKDFYKNFARQYTVSPAGIRIAILTMSNFTFDIADFNQISSISALYGELFNIFFDGSEGNDVFDVLNTVQNMTKENSGYRPAINNHLIILFSTTSWTGEDPTAVASALRQAGMNIVAIGYGPQANMTQLNSIVGGQDCARPANTNAELQGSILDWISAKTCSAAHYC